MKNKNIAKWWSLAAVLMFAAATFQIVSERFLLGALCFGAAACFLFVADKYRKKSSEFGTLEEYRNDV
ncbi:MAG: hypothetical protein IJL87_08045 [Clostridia bacterium]|nr:hypothetical protein [Clostridia bacterium]